VVYLGINNNPRAYFDPGKVHNITGVLEQPLVKRNGSTPPSGMNMLRWSAAHAQVSLFGLWDFFVGADKAVGELAPHQAASIR